VYFTHDSGGGVFRAPLAGGSVTRLVSGADRQPLAIADDYLYFEQTGDLKKISVSGGAISILAAGVGTVSAIVANGGILYWTCSSCGTVEKQPLAGGTRNLLTSGQDQPISLAVDGRHVFFGTSTALKRIAK